MWQLAKLEESRIFDKIHAIHPLFHIFLFFNMCSYVDLIIFLFFISIFSFLYFLYIIIYVLQNDERLVKVIEDEIGKKLDAYECKENEVLENITKVWPSGILHLFLVI